MGLTLRRLVAKVANTRGLMSCASVLAPAQLGVGTKGGAASLVHSARQYLQRMDDTRAFVKLDFSNAFNSIRRDAVLEAVAEHVPDLLPFANSVYGSPSQLWLDEDQQVASSEGVQQGDPLGPLLFCLALDKSLKGAQCEFTSGYLDDVGLGETVPRLIDRIRGLEAEAKKIGLRLNHAKCEIFGLNLTYRTAWAASGLNFIIRPTEEATLLGSPIDARGVDPALVAKREQLEGVIPRLKKMAAHEAFYLLRSCFAIPRLLYLLRSAPCFASSETSSLDEVIRNALISLGNLKLGAEAWAQASLSVRFGGVGVRSVQDLAPSAFLASMHASAAMVQTLLPAWALQAPDPTLDMALSCWTARGGVIAPTGLDRLTQRVWDEGVCAVKAAGLLERADTSNRARLLASVAPGSGTWLQALPCANLGLRLGCEELRIALGLRLGAPLVRAHRCVCGAEVGPDGHHGLACRRSAGRHRRHALANDVIVRAIRSTEVHAELEPCRLLRDDNKRPDGATLDPWSRGKYLVWDFTCPDTLAPSHLLRSSTAAGSAAEAAEAKKRTKYNELARSGDFTLAPVAVETLGAWGPSALELCRDIGSRIAKCSGDTRSTEFLRQRLGIAVQKGNAAAVLGTLPSEPPPHLEHGARLCDD